MSPMLHYNSIPQCNASNAYDTSKEISIYLND